MTVAARQVKPPYHRHAALWRAGRRPRRGSAAGSGFEIPVDFTGK
jgi:hypothetical protein